MRIQQIFQAKLLVNRTKKIHSENAWPKGNTGIYTAEGNPEPPLVCEMPARLELGIFAIIDKANLVTATPSDSLLYIESKLAAMHPWKRYELSMWKYLFECVTRALKY